MPRGRRPKPTHLKLIEGNPGKRPIDGAEPQPGIVVGDTRGLVYLLRIEE